MPYCIVDHDEDCQRLCARIFYLVHVAEVGGIGPNEVEEGFGQLLRHPRIAEIIGRSFEQATYVVDIDGSMREQQRPKLHDGCPCIADTRSRGLSTPYVRDVLLLTRRHCNMERNGGD